MPRQKKEEMRSNDGDAVVNQTAADAASSSRWSDVPEIILHLILTLLRPRIVDLLAFRRVCRSWRSAARETLPPLLLLRSPSNPASVTFHSILEPGLHGSKRLLGLHKYCIGVSHGHLIMADILESKEPSVINPLSGAAIHFPRSPICLAGAVLSAPPTSSDCWLVGWGDGLRPGCPALAFWRPGRTACRVQLLHREQMVGDVIPLGKDRFVITWPASRCMTVARLVVDPDLLHPLLIELELTPPLPSEFKHGLERFLVVVVVLGGELWVLDFPLSVKDSNQRMWLKACRLDSARGKSAWVEEPSRLAGKALLASRYGKSAWVEEPFRLAGKALLASRYGCIVLDDPGNWGGKGNCIYFKRPAYGALTRFSLEDMKVDFLSEDSPLSSDCLYELGWTCLSSYY